MHKERNETLGYLQGMLEDDLTEKVLVPLFAKLGYTDVVFHGGAYEAGKDLIAFKRGPFDRLSLFVAQVKRFKTTRSFEARKLWSEIIYQLRQAKERPVACKDGYERLPSEVAFITPYVIDVRLVEEQLRNVNLSGITIIDGASLYDEIRRTWPTLIADVMGFEGKLSHTATHSLRNTELFESLKIGDEVEYENIYSDLTFFVGRTDTRDLISSSIEVVEKPTEISHELWKELKENLIQVEDLLGFKVISDKIKGIEDHFASRVAAHEAPENIKAGLALGEQQKQLAVVDLQFRTTLASLKRTAKNAAAYTKKDSPEKELRKLPDELERLRQDLDADGSAKILSQADGMIYKTKVSLPKLTSVHQDLDAIRKSLGWASEIIQEKNILETSYIQRPMVSIDLDVDGICDYINSQVGWLRRSVETLNSANKNSVDLKKFLHKVETLLGAVNRLAYTRTFGRQVFSLKRGPDFENRFEISAHSVFDSGMNIAVYGEAGAGKSTTLHMYAKRRAQYDRSSNEALVFVPINRVMAAGSANAFEGQVLQDEGLVKLFIRYVLNYVKADGSERGIAEFLSWMATKSRVIFIIDGLDEAATNSVWLLRAINKIRSVIPNSQVIISSRDCIEEIKDIEFLGITLLPFTETQLKRFVEGWGKKGVKLWELIQERHLFEVAKNPLLATIVCSLYEHGISIPENEPEVYRRKIELLCGQYDAFKKVSRTTSPRELLERVARKIAFHMHEQHVREIDREGISSLLNAAFGDGLTKEAYELAADELISPCNVLKRIPNTAMIGFGHLRYQEFLAAEELIRSNEHSALNYIYLDWWRGALYLYSFGANIASIMENMYALNRNFSKSAGTLSEMIKAKPIKEQRRLTKLLRQYLEMEVRDELRVGIDEYSAVEPFEVGYGRRLVEGNWDV